MSLDLHLAILQPVVQPADLRPFSGLPLLVAPATAMETAQILDALAPFLDEVTALDFETKGDTANPDTYPVGVGLSNSKGSVYIDFRTHPDVYPRIIQFLLDHRVPLIGHNIFFDGAWSMRDYYLDADRIKKRPQDHKRPGAWLNWYRCTYAMARHLASEGYPQFKYGLKELQGTMLSWDETNEPELDVWLIQNGHDQNTETFPKEGYYWFPRWTEGDRTVDHDLTDYEEPGLADLNEKGEPSKEWRAEARKRPGRWASPKKEMMYLAPLEILGTYCALDAHSTWLLWKHVLQPAEDKFPGQALASELVVRQIRLLVWQKACGILVDRAALDAHTQQMQAEIEVARIEFAEDPLVAPHLKALGEQLLKEMDATEPKQFKGTWPPKVPSNPMKKDGSPSQAYLAYLRKVEEGPTLSKNWESWTRRRAELEQQIATHQHFNIESPKQCQWLFYERLGFPVVVRTDKGDPATDDQACKGFGEPGKKLIRIREALTELGFNDTLRGVLNPETGRYHPSFKVPGTHTGRLSGAGGLNAQNAPKSLDFLRVYTVDDGYSLVTFDWASLEDYVLAELSRDPSLVAFYGPSARPGNCQYLYVGSKLPVIGPKIRAAGYDPNNWTKESVAKAKKEAYFERSVLAKKLVLSANYKAGPTKIWSDLRIEGVDIPLQTVEEMHQGFWRERAGVLTWEKELKRQWKANEGWLVNGMGRPICMEAMREKDLINGMCQSTGHDIHTLTQLLVEEAAEYYGFDWFPWHMDIHDCFIAAVRTKEVLDFADMVSEELVPVVNQVIGGLIKLRGSPNVCQNWAEDKDETYDWKATGRYIQARCNANVRDAALASGRCSSSWSDAYNRKYGGTDSLKGAISAPAQNPIRGGRSVLPKPTSKWPGARN